MAFRIIEIIDGNTFKVEPRWMWNGKEGGIVKSNGYDAPAAGQPEYDELLAELKRLLSKKEIELRNPKRISFGQVLCDVFVDGKSLSEHLLERTST